jgi:hypothetical protein
MNKPRRPVNSFALKGSPQMRVYRTYEDWQAEQQLNLCTPEQRGIRVGSPVMWRHRINQVIVTDRAIVSAVDNNTLTLQVKDVEMRVCTADICEIVNNHNLFSGHLTLAEVNRHIPTQPETASYNGVSFAIS